MLGGKERRRRLTGEEEVKRNEMGEGKGKIEKVEKKGDRGDVGRHESKQTKAEVLVLLSE